MFSSGCMCMSVFVSLYFCLDVVGHNSSGTLFKVKGAFADGEPKIENNKEVMKEKSPVCKVLSILFILLEIIPPLDSQNFERKQHSRIPKFISINPDCCRSHSPHPFLSLKAWHVHRVTWTLSWHPTMRISHKWKSSSISNYNMKRDGEVFSNVIDAHLSN